MTDRLIKITTVGAVVLVALVAAVVSYRHAFELVRDHGEDGWTAYLVPITVDGLVWAASMVILDAVRRDRPVPPLAAWSLGAGIAATVGANLAHGLDHGPIGALVGAWPALALVGSYELLMMLLRTATATAPEPAHEPAQEAELPAPREETESPEPFQDHPGEGKSRAPEAAQRAGRGPTSESSLEAAVLADYLASLNTPGPPASQRRLAAKHGLSRRKVREIITSADQQ